MNHPLRLLLLFLAMAALAACAPPPDGAPPGDRSPAGRSPGAATGSAAPAPAVEAGRWLHDTESACAVWDPFPGDEQSVQWNGLCVDGKAEGEGELQIARPGDYRVHVDRYEGEMLAGKMHGLGMLTWARGGSYDGQWRDGLPHGTATMVTKSGVRIVGTFVDGVPQGNFVMTDTSGLVFDGSMRVAEWAKPEIRRQVVKDLASSEEVMKALSGEGTIIYPGGQRFEGRFNIGEDWIEGRCQAATSEPYFPCCRRHDIWVECPAEN